MQSLVCGQCSTALALSLCGTLSGKCEQRATIVCTAVGAFVWRSDMLLLLLAGSSRHELVERSCLLVPFRAKHNRNSSLFANVRSQTTALLCAEYDYHHGTWACCMFGSGAT